ncbi:MAG: amidase [Gammaproteobacteria bacterium]|nr:amidase [Gammaproteobacteria bacterium]
MTVDSSLLTATMHDVAPLIERGELSPVALTEAMLARIAAVDPGIGSYLTVTAELALAQAREAEAAIAGGDYRGPLHGMPIALKDLVNTADIPTTCASPLLRDFRPGYDAAVVERLNAAGAVTLGKLALTEFALYGYHPEFAPPRNPWKTTHWAGVSSSGSGAATAAALCYGCLGTDTGGSIRFPSAACGVVGIKPTFGKVSRYGVFPLADTLDHIGPMARSVADCAAMLAVLEGRDPRDGATRTDPPGDYGTALVAGCQGLRIGIDHAYCTSGTDPVVAQALFDAVDLLAANGAIVVELNAPQLADCAQYWLDVCAVDALIGHRDFYPQHADDYGPAFRALLDHGTTVGATAYARATRERQVTTALLDELLAGIDVLVCPGMPTPAPEQPDPQALMANDEVPALIRFSAPTNFSGHPSITLPNGFTADGLPLAMQFIGRHGDEAAIIRAAAAYEALTDWHTRRPAL